MVRTQLYLDPEAMDRLKLLGRQQGKSVSALVREAIDQLFLRNSKPVDWEAQFDQAVGSWKRPSDEPEPEDVVRRMRQDADRSARWR